jgi:hypothetical protein
MTGGPISDRRLVSCEKDIVTFLARSKDKTKPKHQVAEKLSGVEFTRRWSLHILPKGFTKTRCYGGYSGRYRQRFIALCDSLRPQSSADQLHTPSSVTSDPQQSEQQHDVESILDPRAPTCPRCQQPMHPISQTSRPSWRELFYGPAHRAWFES